MGKPNLRTAIQAINKHGALLVYPLNNKPEPPSLWSCFYPRLKMRWEWTDDGDDKVSDLWHLRAKLSTCEQVVYTKWYQGRATFFSFPLFTAMLSAVSTLPNPTADLTKEAQTILELLEDDSPLPTKRLRALAELEGKHFEGAFQKAVRQLSQRLLIVGYGEMEEGGFPSLAVGATRMLFEELWDDSLTIDDAAREQKITTILPPQSLFLKAYRRLTAQLPDVRLKTGLMAPGLQAG